MGQAGLLLLHHATFGIRKNQKPVIITRFCKNHKDNQWQHVSMLNKQVTWDVEAA